METANQANDHLSSSSSSSAEDLDHPDLNNTSPQQQEDIDNDEAQSQPTEEHASSVVAKTKKAAKKKPKTKVIFNISDTRYEVVRYVGKKLLHYKLTNEPEVEWDIFWTDSAVQPETLAKMQPFQKINHFPGMYSLARKNHLGRNLMRMKRAFPQHFKFFPQTFLLPAEYGEFKQQFVNKKKPVTFIVKPEASCQGRGIFLTRTWEDVQPGEHYVAQRYLHKPYLLDGLKFDLRIYVLVAGCDPLRIFVYDDGLGRFATEEYIAPTSDNLENMCMHLTNYAINKDNPNFVFNKSADDDDVGHKRSLKAVLKMLEEKGHDVKTLWNDIKKIIIKTMCSVQPILAHSYKSCQPDEPYNNMCFEILGLDIMLDHKLKPWLIEVNHTPSFTTDTPLDKTIKRGVIKDALKIMNISVNNRIRYKNKKKVEIQQRALTGKKIKLTLEEKQAAHEKAQQERDIWESKHLGGYEKIYPLDDPTKSEEPYEEFIKSAHKSWEEWTGTSRRRNTKKSIDVEPTVKAQATTTTGNQGFMGPQISQGMVRAKEIKSIYSQKLKVGSQNPRVMSNQKPRKPEDTPPIDIKQSNSAQNPQNPDSNIKSEVKIADQAQDAVQPWSFNDLNFIAFDKVIEEEEDDHNPVGCLVPLVNQGASVTATNTKREIGNVGLDLMKKFQLSDLQNKSTGEDQSNQERLSRISIYTTTSATPVGGHIDFIRSASSRARHGNESVPTKDTHSLVPNRDKENSKLFLMKSIKGVSSNSKFPQIGQGTLSKVMSKNDVLPERADTTAQKRRTMTMKSYLKPVNKGENQAISIGEIPPYDNLMDYDNKPKTSDHSEYNERLIGNIDPQMKPNAKKMASILAQQQKNFTNNYVTVAPKLFELNMKNSKPTQPGNGIIGSSAPFGVYGLNKGLNNKLVQQQVNGSNQPAGPFNFSQASQINAQKFYSIHGNGKR